MRRITQLLRAGAERKFRRPFHSTTAAILALTAAAMLASPTTSSRALDEDPGAAALALLNEAYKRRHFYDKEFPGFQAKMVCVFGGRKIHGTVRARGPREVEVDLPEATARLWVTEQLSIILSHRLRPPTPDPKTLVLEKPDDHPMGRRISVRDAFDTGYRVLDGRIREVSRDSPPIRFVVNVLDHVKTDDGKELPRHFSASYFDSRSGKLLRTFVFQDSYRRLGKYFLPERRMVVGSSDEGLHTVYFELSEHKLLKKATDL